MALEFPSSPVDGQEYDNYIYSSTKGAWLSKPLTASVAATSDTAPLNPNDGDLWYNTSDGSTYVYYVDIDGGQWVQVKSDSTFTSTLGPRVETLELQSPGTTGQPFRVAAGVAAGNTTAESNAASWYWNQPTTVTFPVGRFTQAPVVTITYNMVDTIGFADLCYSAPTTTGFTFRHHRLGAYPPAYLTYWHAIQMTSSSGAG